VELHLLIVREAAVIVPAPLKVPVIEVVRTGGKVMEVVTVNVKVLLTVSVEPLPIIIELIVPVPPTVRVTPSQIEITSAAVGFREDNAVAQLVIEKIVAVAVPGVQVPVVLA